MRTVNAVALWTQPQIIGAMDAQGRPAPGNGQAQPKSASRADVVVVAIGQGVETHGFEQTKHRHQARRVRRAMASGQIDDMHGVFAGGDCVTGPATVIRAIAAGKVAAANIDEYLGFHHETRPRCRRFPRHG